jgi:hypothetical protein
MPDESEVPGQVELQPFVRVSNARIRREHSLPDVSLVAGLFEQLAPGRHRRFFAGVDLARREFEKMLAQGVPILPLDENRLLIQHR